MATESLHQARFNLAQADRFPTWYDHLDKVNAAVAADDRAIKEWTSLGWELDDDGWHAPEGWDDFWGHPHEDFYLSDEEFARIRSQIDGI